MGMAVEDLRSILEAVANRRISVEEALKKIRLFALEVINNVVRFDVGRYARRDVPEIVFGEGKDIETLKKMIENLLNRVGILVVSRLTNQQIEMLKNIEINNAEVRINEVGRIAVVKLKSVQLPRYLCRVGIVTAGTADIRIAEEAKTVVEIMGCETITVYDVGIAGFQRVLEALKKLKEEDADVVIAIAGMEGALPSVIASLIDVPVIGVPTSVGYGVGGEGVAALYSMLQACPLGLAVVNIDNGVGAGVIAALIGKRIAVARKMCIDRM
jgi:NCAIR mutase (PurE)-related protein